MIDIEEASVLILTALIAISLVAIMIALSDEQDSHSAYMRGFKEGYSKAVDAIVAMNDFIGRNKESR